MTSLPHLDAPDPGALRWVVVDDRHWEARDGSSLVATVEYDARFVVRSVDGGLTGSHTSFESAKAQLESWVRWRRATRTP